MPRIFINQPPKTWRQDIETLHSNRFFHVSNIGPTMFVLKADDHTSTTFKVCIGEPQQCSCGGGEARSKLCVHLLFVMIKVLRVPETNPLSWQLSLVDNEVLQILSNDSRTNGAKDFKKSSEASTFLRKGSGTRQRHNARLSSASVEQTQESLLSVSHSRKDLTEDNLCSICQEEMYEDDFQDNNLCFCQNGCGSNFHKKCLRMYSTHARSENKPVVCPMCRQRWVQAERGGNTKRAMMRSDGFDISKLTMPTVCCKGCKIVARSIFYRAVKWCSEDKRTFDLCRRCFENGNTIGGGIGNEKVFVKAYASEHPVRWMPAVLPIANRAKLLGDVQYRELNSLDYHALLSLDDANSPPMHQHLLRAFDAIDVRECVAMDCALCASPLFQDVCAIRLPCEKGHIVHKSCALNMLIDSESSPNGAAGSRCGACNDGKWLFPALMRQPKKKREPKQSSVSETSLQPIVEAPQLFAIGLPVLQGGTMKPRLMELELAVACSSSRKKKLPAATITQTQTSASSKQSFAGDTLRDVFMIGKPLQTKTKG
jgi:E3 ubiquitin-protein ligase ZSWIM2